MDDPLLDSGDRVFHSDRSSYYICFCLFDYRLEITAYEIFVAWNADDTPWLTPEGKPKLRSKDGMGSPVDTVEAAEVFLTGSVKWDGCSNWDFDTELCQKHFCSKKQATELGDLLGCCYDLAAELIPHWSGE